MRWNLEDRDAFFWFAISPANKGAESGSEILISGYAEKARLGRKERKEAEMRILTAVILIGFTSPALADHFSLGPKATGPRANTNSTVWDATCPAGTTVISCICVVRKRDGAALQNFWHDASSNKWSCAWSAPVTEADVQATCAESK